MRLEQAIKETKTQLRQIARQLSDLEENGDYGSPLWEQLTIKEAELEEDLEYYEEELEDERSMSD